MVRVSACATSAFTFGLLVFQFSYSTVFFHSDFECGETYLARDIAPGDRTIELIPNERLSEWAETNGTGVMEGNLPSSKETFHYRARKGNILEGVEEIFKAHPAHADIRAGNMIEWFTNPELLQVMGANRMQVTDRSPPFGIHSLRIDISDSATHFQLAVPSGKSTYSCRFYVRFSEEVFEKKEKPQLPLCFLIWSPYSLSRLALRTTGAVGSASFMLTANTRNLSVEEEYPAAERRPVKPDQTYCLEYHVQRSDTNEFIVSAFVQGRLEHRQHLRAVPVSSGRHSMFIGQLRGTTPGGSMVLDEIVLGDTIIGTRPATPEIREYGQRLCASDFAESGGTRMHMASQWQISRGNHWLLPVFNSGQTQVELACMNIPVLCVLSDTVNANDVLWEPVRIPTGIQLGGEYLARTRHQNDRGIWSEWSHPLRFTVKNQGELGHATLRLPEMRQAFFAEIDQAQPLDHIVRGKWYDFHFHVQDPKGWSNLAYADIYLCGDPENRIGNYWNRGGTFERQSNYAFSFSIMTNRIFAPETEGSSTISALRNKRSLFLDDSKGQYVQDGEKGMVKARIRLLDSARVGPWLITGYVKNKDNKFSGMYQKLFYVKESETQAQARSGVFPVTIVVGLFAIAASILFLAWKGKSAPVSESAKPDPVDPLRDDSSCSERIRKAREFIRGNFGTNISAKDISGHINVSPAYLSRLFHKETGITVSHFLNSIRVQEARELLRKKDLNIGEIALKVGFNNTYHFSHVFRDLEGISPRDFRAKN